MPNYKEEMVKGGDETQYYVCKCSDKCAHMSGVLFIADPEGAGRKGMDWITLRLD